MGAPDPPYPSFTLVMADAFEFPDTQLRLPAYRVGHLLRYHPYPRVHNRYALDFNEDDDAPMVRYMSHSMVYAPPTRLSQRTVDYRSSGTPEVPTVHWVRAGADLKR
jgi:hypothetical protein